MKKVPAILFIAILLINIMGYYGALRGLQFRNDLRMTHALDANNYDESRTVTIKVPMAIPYQTDQPDFERVDGTFHHAGEVYRLVKQRYATDTLYVVCIRDTEEKFINEVLTDLSKTLTDQSGDHQPTSKIVVSLIKEFIPNSFSLQSNAAAWCTTVVFHTTDPSHVDYIPASVSIPPEAFVVIV